MDHLQRGKRPNRRRRPNKPRQQQQQPQAGTHRSEDPFITKPQRTLLAKLGDRPSLRSCPLTISTRGIGFMVSRVTSVVRQRLNLRSEDIPVAAIYRASLAQLQAKICHMHTKSCRNDYYAILPFKYESREFLSIADAIERQRFVNLCQVALIIDSIGNVEFNGKIFTPVFLEEPSPLNIRLDNLRAYCERMSNLETDPSERIEGYELNSIPNAKWERIDGNDKESIVLTNPDEIIPPDYHCNEAKAVRNDLRTTDEWIYKTSQRIRDLGTKIRDGKGGHPGMLVSTHVVPGQSLKLDNDVISGSESQFWSLEPINDASWCLGVFGLVGETLNPMNGSARSNVGAMRAVVDWHQISVMTV